MKVRSHNVDWRPSTLVLGLNEQPQQRFETNGLGALTDAELLALVLPASGRGQALKLASQLIAKAGSIAALASWQPTDFQQLDGIGYAKARQLSALVEAGRRIMRGSLGEAPLLDRPQVIADYLMPTVRGLDVEKFWVLCLNRKNRLRKLVEVSSGTAMSALAHPREVFRAAIQHGATAIVCAHNHPSGDPAPSTADLMITRQLRETGRTIDIELLDHVILGERDKDPLARGYHSFRDAGIL
jgi:DNA repair protein RadC